VGPDGVWTREAGLLPWPEIARVRCEGILGVGTGPDDIDGGPSTIVTYRRVGIWPRDEARYGPWGWRLIGKAPVGVIDYMLEASIEAVLARIRLYTAVEVPAS
jgi:hypothetical protein